MFERIGISTDILIIVLTVVLFVVLVMLIMMTMQISSLTTNYKKYIKGADGKSLEAIFHEKFDKMDSLSEDLAEYRARVIRLENEKNSGFCKFSVRKYNAFEDVKGNTSFSVCMLDDTNDGFVLTSIHSEGGCYTYLKEVIKGKPYTKLSAEEQKTLNEALVYNDPVAEVKNSI